VISRAEVSPRLPACAPRARVCHAGPCARIAGSSCPLPSAVLTAPSTDALLFGSPTINGDAVKPVWDLLSSLAVVNLKGKLGAAFGSYGWTGEAVRMIEDRMRGLKMRVPVSGVRIKLIPSEEELQECRIFGREVAATLTGRRDSKAVLDLADLV